MKPVRLLIVGAGGRGGGFARYAQQHPDQARVVGVAEPRDYQRQTLVERHAIAPENVFTDWRQAAGRPRFADAVIIATQDAMHVEPAVAFTALGYHMLLEKPMAPDEAGCRQVASAVQKAGIIFAVGHVLRYTAYTRKLKSLLDAGAIGDIVSIQHLEPVGYFHYAHSYVRGNWRREDESSPILLSKSCHDLDWIRHVMGVPCRRVSSFGSLRHFRPSDAPEGAAARCVDCAVEADCPYSAKRIYLGRVERGHTGWPVNVITDDTTAEGVLAALRDGPYGRCVYACDNDVLDNQVVAMEFEGGRTAVFTMVAFTDMANRRTRIFGTRGQITGDGRLIRVFDFLSDKETVVDSESADGGILGGHGGGDHGLMNAFVSAVAAGDRSRVLSGPAETLESHLMVFAAERARLENRVVELDVAGESAGPALLTGGA